MDDRGRVWNADLFALMTKRCTSVDRFEPLLTDLSAEHFGDEDPVEAATVRQPGGALLNQPKRKSFPIDGPFAPYHGAPTFD
jgi:hypothetical protein